MFFNRETDLTDISSSEAFCVISVSSILTYSKDCQIVYQSEGPELKAKMQQKKSLLG